MALPSKTSEELEADAGAFDLLRDVLNGTRRIPLDHSSSKMLRILLGGDSDATIMAAQFVVHFGAQKQRRPCQYFRRLSPGMMSELLGRAAINAVAAPVVVGLPASRVPHTGMFPEWSYEAKLVWIVPGPESVDVRVRTSPQAWTAPFAEAIPEEGPRMFRALAEWTPREVTYRHLDTALACPGCGTTATRYRQLPGALVCLACNRSFDDRE